MSDIDVRALAAEELPRGEFPAAAQSPFRLFLEPAVHAGVRQHAQADVSVEICGVLVGLWKSDANGPYAEATDFIRCNAAESKFAEVTFTHESWSQINEEMDSKYDDKRILGWYHSHPDFGIFLSDRDVFIHEHFFSGPGQVAYVVDPVRELEGCFAWRDGKPALLPHYWVGNDLVSSQANTANERAEGASRAGEAAAADAVAYAERGSAGGDAPLFGSLTTLLAALSLFLLGYLLAGWRTRWEQSMIVEGAVSHYGFNKLIHFGLADKLTRLHKDLDVVRAAVSKLPAADAELEGDAIENAAKLRKAIDQGLAAAGKSLDSLATLYGFSPEEEALLSRIVAAQVDALRAPKKPATGKPRSPGAAKPAKPPGGAAQGPPPAAPDSGVGRADANAPAPPDGDSVEPAPDVEPSNAEQPHGEAVRTEPPPGEPPSEPAADDAAAQRATPPHRHFLAA